MVNCLEDHIKQVWGSAPGLAVLEGESGMKTVLPPVFDVKLLESL